ncbi:uncharacterized protein LAESUDRAFT_765617 [Laetiporus sulphureus 93-53]|uniref:Uncharacterized protein n=1 Tax=Laetiporus sulphureus 93-53 TaxID=1314785 RepID=A0A165ANW9_9APHY|nr:uncharacterized protein LAESUDRAFT_765617 [Laetiporus sulphureus 93-53]KZS99373.1 hypothetical protein LAESUDRAFT_765617 [Laetiporus sulphureus 93-53]
MRHVDRVLKVTQMYKCIQDVDLKLFRATAEAFDPSLEDGYSALQDHMREYYLEIADRLLDLQILTLRHIATSNPGQGLKPHPFSHPQERDTIIRYSDFMTRFVIFLLRHHQQPLPDLQVEFHPMHRESLDALVDVIGGSHSRSRWMSTIHRVILFILTCRSDGFLKAEWKDLFSIFLIAYHLRDDHGNMHATARITPNISKVQWCFRATAAQETLYRSVHHNNNDVK